MILFMQRVLFILIFIFLAMENNSQTRSFDRQPVAAGRFYPAGRETLVRDITRHFDECVKLTGSHKVRAVISPHAGYVFSGKIAASAFSSVDRTRPIKNIFLIGSSHIMAFEGASVYVSGDFVTPLGKAVVNREIGEQLRRENRLFNTSVSAHQQEHSLEVQIPFIQHWFGPDQKIVPIIIGTNNTGSIKRMAETLKPWFTDDNLFVISSDFSHYPSYNDANRIDRKTADAIISGIPDEFLKVLKSNEAGKTGGLSTSMCGWTSGLLLMYLTENNPQLEYLHIDYCNSGDTNFGSKDEVVGYHAIAVVEKMVSKGSSDDIRGEISFSDNDKSELFAIARNSIRSQFDNRKFTSPDESKLPELLKKPYGAFVTLKIDGRLRGCIGRFISADPLYEAVSASACSSAFEDYRFSPLTRKEFEKTEIEITVLGPLKKISSIKEIVLGKHGIYIKKDNRSGTMLPQVATENGWSVEEFLGYTARDKAGLGWDGWKNAEIYIYEGIVLEENKQ